MQLVSENTRVINFGLKV